MEKFLEVLREVESMRVEIDDSRILEAIYEKGVNA